MILIRSAGPCSRRARPYRRRWAGANSRRERVTCRSRRELKPAREVPEIHFTLGGRRAADAGRLCGAGDGAELLGDVVRAVRRGDAGVGEAGGVGRGARRSAVLPLSSDRGGAAAVEKFYREREIEGLPVLLDPRGEAARAFGARGIPTTVLIDAHGRERGRFEGAADWADADAVAAVRELAK